MTYPMTHPFAVFNENPAHRYRGYNPPPEVRSKAPKLTMGEAQALRPVKKARGACAMCQGRMPNVARHARLFCDGQVHHVCSACNSSLPYRFADPRAMS